VPDVPSTDVLRDLLPHEGRARLLDRIIARRAREVVAEVTIREDSAFASADGVGAWIGLEYMAQAAAALASHQAGSAAPAPRRGWLVGTRRYACDRARFPIGAILEVHAAGDPPGADRAGTFACEITGDGIRAEATIIVLADPTGGEA
jgi:predicted hotdog family 3-hydroxylacyl-ACP dehydratase